MTTSLLLDSYLKQLRLPTFVRQHRAVADDAARQQHDYEHYLLALAELEATQRQQNLQRRCLQAAHLPVLRDLADFDFSCLTSPAKLTVLDLARGAYLFHYTPKHGSWLNMVESELAVLSRQCLDRRIPIVNQLQCEIAAWEVERNQRKVMVKWQFKTTDARIKLKKLYPS